MKKLTFRKMAEMLGFDEQAASEAYGDRIDEVVPAASPEEAAESFIVGVDTNVPFDIDSVTRESFLKAFYADGHTWLDDLTDDEYDTLRERFND